MNRRWASRFSSVANQFVTDVTDVLAGWPHGSLQPQSGWPRKGGEVGGVGAGLAALGGRVLEAAVDRLAANAKHHGDRLPAVAGGAGAHHVKVFAPG